MNPEELRELDAWIFEHWFGATIKHIRDNFSGCFVEHYERSLMTKAVKYPQGICIGSFGGGERTVADYCPKFTTDLAASMMLLKKVAEFLKELGRKKGYNIGLTIEQFDDDEGGWHVAHDSQMVGVTAPTLELALALFSKKLKEGK